MFAPAYASGGSQSFQIKKDQFKYFVIERQNEKEVAYGKSKKKFGKIKGGLQYSA